MIIIIMLQISSKTRLISRIEHAVNRQLDFVSGSMLVDEVK